VPPKNITALVEAMRTLLADEALRKRYARAARTFVAENFSREYIWEELRREYDRLLSGYSPQRQGGTANSKG
jgi:glycosyltransferase involved in cell wall biosynthesis